MVKKTLSLLDINRQIAALQKQADDLKAKEKSGVVGRIKEAIDAYGLTPADLFGPSTKKSAKVKTSVETTKSNTKIAYSDGAGNTWGGRGPRPAWLREAIAAGKELKDFASAGNATADQPVEASATADSAAKKARTAKSKKPAQKVAPKYKDEGGNTWSGRGLQPVWLKTALAQGKALQDFAI